MRSICVAFVVAALLLSRAPGGPAQAQGVRIGPGGVEITPGPDRRAPLPGAVVRDEVRERLLRLRGECEDGDRRACVRFGMILGENRQRQAEWRRDHPEVFFFER
jgi:hypothetical protein